MDRPTHASGSKARLPTALVWAVVAISGLSFLLSLAGVDFGIRAGIFDAATTTIHAPQEVANALHHTLKGIPTHTFLEWSAFYAVLFTALLALIHFNIKRDPTPLVIGIILFVAGTIDAFHALAADRLLETVVDSQNFMPFTWVACRLFTALIMIVGVCMALAMQPSPRQSSLGLALFVSAIFGVFAYGIIHVSASVHLPQTMFPEAIVPRPYDLVPLLFFLFTGAFVYPRLHQQVPSAFSHALILSTLPSVAMQLHMTFGSSRLFDHHFNIAHFLKVITYLVPLAGLTLDHLQTYRDKDLAVQRLAATQDMLRERTARLEQANADLAQRNAELDEFNYIASHDLQEPVRKLIAFSHHLRKDLGPSLSARAQQDISFIVDAATRLQTLIHDLLALSRAGGTAMQRAWVPLDTCVDRALEVLATRVQETSARITRDPLPVVWGDPTLLTQIYQNLIDNALKFVRHSQPVVRLTAERRADGWLFGVQDRGIGLSPEYAEEIFAPFKRLHSRAEYPGTGIGLAICRKAVERHGGRIWVESQPGKGTHFKFTLDTKIQGKGKNAHDSDQG
jgi:signal transduction histidine kinase